MAESLMRHLHALHSIGPGNNDRLSALRLAVLLLIGRPELIIYAVFGALTGMYGRSEPHQLRLRHQLQAALVLLTGVGVGVFLSVNHLHSWWLVGVEALLAGVGSIYSDRVNLRPNGPFFGILALGACASVPIAIPWQLALLISAAAAAFSLAVGFGGWIRAREWDPGAVRDAGLLRRRRPGLEMIHAARYVLAVGIAGHGVCRDGGAGHRLPVHDRTFHDPALRFAHGLVHSGDFADDAPCGPGGPVRADH